MDKTQTVYISLGSNLGAKKLHLQKAIFLISKSLGIVRKISPIYASPSWGFESDDFLNACLSLETSLSPDDLLGELMHIEKSLGRQRGTSESYQNRTIDLDIIYYGNVVVENEHLVIPHPKLLK